MPRLSLTALLLVVACARPVLVTPYSYRDPAVPIYSSAVLTPDQIAGQWRQVADFAAAPRPCRAGPVGITPALQIDARLCLSGQAVPVAGRLIPVGPGRFAAPGLPDPWWVLWADADRRTLVIGTPSGQVGFVLNRGGPLPADRLTALRDVLAFNGYDLNTLRLLP